ncbi:hypothetical protein HGRIS_003296 [Hohenbuehelia grisea]|uniref:Uncharacterized protein n=1 Tax=Hohenbuehelia grisea TaxID=104357 RepID=A0ABR3JF82_9AGAR
MPTVLASREYKNIPILPGIMDKVMDVLGKNKIDAGVYGPANQHTIPAVLHVEEEWHIAHSVRTFQPQCSIHPDAACYRQTYFAEKFA